MHDLDDISAAARRDFDAAPTPAALEDAKARYLGKSGRVTELLKGMAALSPEDKKSRGAAINVCKQAIEAALNARRQALADHELEVQLRAEALDVSLPGRQAGQGGLHPVSRTMERIEQIFGSMGFDVADGPEIETDWHSFTALNNPENHPARSMQDTFYVDLKDEQGRPAVPAPAHLADAGALCAGPCAGATQGQDPMPEIRVIAPGRTYRVDSDATHSPMFHQCEGLWIGEHVSFADLKAVFTDFFRTFFETDALQLRFRPSFFPFTEPSAEVDIAFASGPLKGRWLEVAGSGQVHPERGAQLRSRPRAPHRLCLRHGPRPPDHAALRRQRPAPVLRRRPALPAAVPLTVRTKESPCSFQNPGCAPSATPT